MLLGCQRSDYLSGWSLFRGLGAGGSSFWGWLSVGAGRSWGWSVMGLVGWLAKRAPTTCSFVWLVLVTGKGVNRRMVGCEKSAVGRGGSLFCTSHYGGGRRCSVDGCLKQIGLVVYKILCQTRQG